MKGSGVRVGAACEIGPQSIVLYESEMKPGARLGALSLLMKGETLAAGRLWMGSPLDTTGDITEPAELVTGEHKFTAAAGGK